MWCVLHAHQCVTVRINPTRGIRHARWCARCINPRRGAVLRARTCQGCACLRCPLWVGVVTVVGMGQCRHCRGCRWQGTCAHETSIEYRNCQQRQKKPCNYIPIMHQHGQKRESPLQPMFGARKGMVTS